MRRIGREEVRMKKYVGIGVYDAVAEGNIAVYGKEEYVPEKVYRGDLPGEKARLEAAREAVREQLEESRVRTLAEAGAEVARIFEVHKMLLDDGEFNGAIRRVIEREGVNAEYAVAVTAEGLADRFAALADDCLKARAADIRDISRQLLACLQGSSCEKREMEGPGVICARDLSPSETASLDREKVLGIVTARGSLYSHMAILARARGIPAVVGVGEAFLEEAGEGTPVMVDGCTGEVYLYPDAETRTFLLRKMGEQQEEKRLLEALKGKADRTLDGRSIHICANIGGAEELEAVLLNDAAGIGLFRSEFLYLGRDTYPTEEEQFAAYRKVLEGMVGKRVIIRTLDIGGDKQADYFGLGKEENPAMGYRAIRICLTRPEIFKTQLRALYRASVYGRLGILFPMITGRAELEKALEICREVKEELSARGIPFSENVETGIMIETPAAAIISDRLAPLVDFFSVGTNDLTQFTLACDRQNPEVQPFADPRHEAVLRLIRMSAENARRHGIRIGICGELAADPELTETFLRMGIDELSVSPPLVLKLRAAVRSLDLARGKGER